MQKKTGVSLIVLVITIIVMVILAGTIIIALDDADIIEKAEGAVTQYNLNEVKNLANVAWAEAYMSGARTQEQLQTKVTEILSKQIDVTQYLISVTTRGVNISPANKWLTAIVDDVPIPKGFVASQATGENTKNGGLVIYEGTEPVTNANVEIAKRTRNQYVWVPVPKEQFTTKFVRGAYNNTKYSNVLGEGEWEVVLDTTTNMPLATQDPTFMTAETLAEVQAMYESVKEYEGFYIARYEAGLDTQRTSNTTLVKGTSVYSMMGKIPYSYISWAATHKSEMGGAVEVARSMYPETDTNYGVVSTLTYGVQWDRTLAWWLEVGAKDGKGNTITSLTDSTSYGNYENHVIAAGDLNDGAKYASYNQMDAYLEDYKEVETDTTKASGTKLGLTTGALKVAKVNNICDMAGNMQEATMEHFSHYSDMYFDTNWRGGSYASCGGNSTYTSPVSDRYTDLSGMAYGNNGFRPSLYIKNIEE